jgi:hypothetical protein
VASASAMMMAHANASTIVVDQSNPNGWQFKEIDGNTGAAIPMGGGYSGTLVNGPSTPPLGSGSARLTTGADGANAVKLETSNFNGTTLSSIAGANGSFNYSTFVTTNNGGVPANNAQAPYLQVVVDLNNNGVFDGDGVDDRLFFEPVYQSGSYPSVGSPAPIAQDGGDGDGQAPTVGRWETWDVKNGGFWTASQFDGTGNSGPPTETLAAYVANHPTATIIDRNGDNLGVEMVAGFGGPADWGNFDGNVDAFNINGTTYDFELPEPASLGILAFGGFFLARRTRRKTGASA